MQYSIENDILRLIRGYPRRGGLSASSTSPPGLNCSGGATPLSGAAMRPFCSPTPGKLTGGKMIAKGVEYAGGQHGFAGMWSTR